MLAPYIIIIKSLDILAAVTRSSLVTSGIISPPMSSSSEYTHLFVRYPSSYEIRVIYTHLCTIYTHICSLRAVYTHISHLNTIRMQLMCNVHQHMQLTYNVYPCMQLTCSLTWVQFIPTYMQCTHTYAA